MGVGRACVVQGLLTDDKDEDPKYQLFILTSEAFVESIGKKLQELICFKGKGEG